MGIVVKVLNRQYHRNQDREQGFTLIELVITIAIMAIIAAMAAPSMQKQIQQAKTREAASVFVNALKEARSQALITQSNTIVTLDTAAKRITLTSGAVNASNSTSKTYQIDNSVNISQISDAPNTITFAANKGVYQGTDTESTERKKITLGMGYGVCFNKGLLKSIVKVDGNGSISTEETAVNGSCS